MNCYVSAQESIVYLYGGKTPVKKERIRLFDNIHDKKKSEQKIEIVCKRRGFKLYLSINL